MKDVLDKLRFTTRQPETPPPLTPEQELGVKAVREFAYDDSAHF